MITNLIYQLIGEGIIIVFAVIVLLILFALIISKIILKRNKIIFPRAIIFIFDILYSPAKKFCKLVGVDETTIDVIGVKVRNELNREKFQKIPANRTVIFLPHCLRHRDCEAPLKKEGITCTDCKKCAIGTIKRKAEPLGYTLYIVPGSSFVKKIVKEEDDFDAVIGIACYEDLNQIMMLLSEYHPQGALLTKTGCFETKVDLKSALEIINSKKVKNDEYQSS